ncbi:MAG: hypothetical protein EBV73_07360 [Rhodocyclales bacterium]|jgi:hypothetical protein|nr:hypothetical protein [Rhodocyclales bacterium]
MLNTHTLLVEHAFELMPFLQNLAVGVFGLFASIWINVFFLRRVSIYYELNARIHLGRDCFNRVFLTYLISITFLMLIQVLLMVAWGSYIYLLGLSDHFFGALLFAGSCYTTIGVVSDDMPNAWKLQAIFIALSGLFAIALSTASMLNMAPLFRQAWYRKHDKKLRAVLLKHGIPTSGLDILEDNASASQKNDT